MSFRISSITEENAEALYLERGWQLEKLTEPPAHYPKEDTCVPERCNVKPDRIFINYKGAVISENSLKPRVNFLFVDHYKPLDEVIVPHFPTGFIVILRKTFYNNQNSVGEDPYWEFWGEGEYQHQPVWHLVDEIKELLRCFQNGYNRNLWAWEAKKLTDEVQSAVTSDLYSQIRKRFYTDIDSEDCKSLCQSGFAKRNRQNSEENREQTWEEILFREDFEPVKEAEELREIFDVDDYDIYD